MERGGSRAGWIDWLAPAVLALGIAVLVPPLLDAAGAGMEEGQLLVYPDLIGDGLWPMSDYQSVYGPANSLLLHVVYGLAPGIDLTAERLVGLLYRALIVFAVYAIARRRGPVVGLAAGAMSIALLVPTGPAAEPWYAAAACGTWGVALITGEGTNRQASGAFLLTLASAFRPEFAAGAVLTIGASCLFIRERRHLVIGAAIGLIPLVIWIVGISPGTFLTHFFGDAWRQSRSSERHVSLLTSQPTHNILLAMGLAAPLALVAVWRRRRDTTLVLAAWTFALAPQAVQRATESHLLEVASVGVPLAFAVLMPVDREPSLRRALLPIGVAVALMAVIPAATSQSLHRFVDGLTGARPSTVTADRDGHRFLLDPGPPARNVERAVRIAASQGPPGARLFVGPSNLRFAVYNDTYVYDLLSEYEPATYYLEMNPGVANRAGSGLASDIRSAGILLLDSSLNPDPLPASAEPGPRRSNRVIARDFCPVGEAGPWTVLRRCRLPGSGARPSSKSATTGKGG